MGSDPKSKEKSRKRVSDSQSQDEGQPKRHRRSSDEYAEEGSRKRDQKDKSHRTKSHKRDSNKEKKSEKKHKGKHSKHDRKSIPDFKELSKDDYFLKNNEFSTWLTEEKKKFFSDLSSDLARELFSEFVEVWNSEKLRSKYYKGIKTGTRSSHSWKIKD